MSKGMKLSSQDQMLRGCTIGLWIVAFPLLLAHGIVADAVCPALGIIPITFSTFYGAVHLWGKARWHTANLAMDLFLALFQLGILIPSFILLDASVGWRRDSGKIILGTYATMPMVLSFLIHSYFVLREIQLPPLAITCPHCHSDLRPMCRPRMERSQYRLAPHDDEAGSESSKEYSSPQGHGSVEATPRPSTDDETARLV